MGPYNGTHPTSDTHGQGLCNRRVLRQAANTGHQVNWADQLCFQAKPWHLLWCYWSRLSHREVGLPRRRRLSGQPH